METNDHVEDTSTPEFDALGDFLDGEFNDGSAADTTTEDTVTVDDGNATETEGEGEGETEGNATETEGEAEDEGTQDTQASNDPTVTQKDSIKEALRELESERLSYDAARRTMRDEARQAYYPEGLKEGVPLDSEGNPINGVSDIAGRLINPDTQEVFTWEEARDWYDRAMQQQKDRISSIEQDIDAIAEVNQNLQEGERRVMEKYGDMLKLMPEVAKEAFEGFQGLLVVNPKTGIIESVKMDVERYYDMVMKPYIAVARQESLKAEGERQRQAEEQAEAEKKEAKTAQLDRADLPLSSSDGKGTVEKDALDMAFEEYLTS